MVVLTLSSTLAKVIGAAVVLGATAFLALLLWGLLASDDSDETPDITGLTTPEVINLVEGAVSRPGQVLHSRIEATVQAEGETAPYYSMELWVDASHETARSEYHLASEQDAYDRATEATAIVSGRYIYVPDDANEALRYELEETSCPGVDAAWLSALLLCEANWTSTAPSPLGEPRVESGDFRGHRAIVLAFEMSETVRITDPDQPPSPLPPPTGPTPLATSVAATEAPGETQTITTTWRIYIDAGDYLPLAYTLTQEAGGDRAGVVEAVYENEFIPLDDEIEALLDPRSIGYGAENAEALLDEIEGHVSVYWLGDEFQADGLGELVLARILVGEQQGGVQQVYRVGGELIYEAPDGYPEVRLLLWPRDDWDAFLSSREGEILSDESCTQTQDVQTGDLPSTVYILPLIEKPGPAQAPNESQCNFERLQVALLDRVIGVIEFEDVVVQVRQDGYAESLSEMQLLLQHLRPR